MKLSIVTVVYNSIEGIERTIRSVISQSYNDYEYIIIDGGSTDGTLDVISKYRNYVNVCISEKDDGVYDAMNKAIGHCNGEWVVYMNAGDTFVSESTINNIFASNRDWSDVDVIYGDKIDCYKEGRVYSSARPKELLEYRMPFCHQTSYVRLSLLKEYKFNLHYKLASDYDFFHRLYKDGKTFVYINEPLSCYYLEGGLSDSNMVKLFREESVVSGKRDLVWLKRCVHVFFSYFARLFMPAQLLFRIRNMCRKSRLYEKY